MSIQTNVKRGVKVKYHLTCERPPLSFYGCGEAVLIIIGIKSEQLSFSAPITGTCKKSVLNKGEGKEGQIRLDSMALSL